MDEMRQLVRILVKLMPNSVHHLSLSDEGGGGNRVSEEQIKEYLRLTLGTEAPQPEWGLPDGWGQYLSSLFTWALDRRISRDEAMMCARRLPGRSWEAVDEELARLGLHPHVWPMPLTKSGIQAAIKAHTRGDDTASDHASPGVSESPSGSMAAAAALLASAAAVNKRGGATQHLDNSKEAKRRKGTATATSSPKPTGQSLSGHPATTGLTGISGRVGGPPYQLPDPGDMTELECWHVALKYLQAAHVKQGTTPQDSLGDLLTTRDLCRKITNQSSKVEQAAAVAASVLPPALPSALPPLPFPHPAPLRASFPLQFMRGGEEQVTPVTSPLAPIAGSPASQLHPVEPLHTLPAQLTSSAEAQQQALAYLMHGSAAAVQRVALPQQQSVGAAAASVSKGGGAVGTAGGSSVAGEGDVMTLTAHVVKPLAVKASCCAGDGMRPESAVHNAPTGGAASAANGSDPQGDHVRLGHEGTGFMPFSSAVMRNGHHSAAVGPSREAHGKMLGKLGEGVKLFKEEGSAPAAPGRPDSREAGGSSQDGPHLRALSHELRSTLHGHIENAAASVSSSLARATAHPGHASSNGHHPGASYGAQGGVAGHTGQNSMPGQGAATPGASAHLPTEPAAARCSGGPGQADGGAIGEGVLLEGVGAGVHHAVKLAADRATAEAEAAAAAAVAAAAKASGS